MALEGCFVELVRTQRPRRGGGLRRVVKPLSGVEQGARHRAIEQAGIEVPQAIMGGKALAERALAGGGRSVDCDDHGVALNCERNLRRTGRSLLRLWTTGLRLGTIWRSKVPFVFTSRLRNISLKYVCQIFRKGWTVRVEAQHRDAAQRCIAKAQSLVGRI